jgi:hypothetical protein
MMDKTGLNPATATHQGPPHPTAKPPHVTGDFTGDGKAPTSAIEWEEAVKKQEVSG